MSSARIDRGHEIGSSIGLALVAVYRALLGAQLGGACRFEPNCSEYAAQCFARHGLFRGMYLAGARTWRCRPGVAGGFDPAP